MNYCRSVNNSYLSMNSKINIMNKIWKKLLDLAVVSLVPMLIELAVDYLQDLKKKIQDSETNQA